MTTEKQIAANRRNAQKSTGPKTEQGKHRSRQNAFRHGLTAQTIIRFVENADEYTELDALIIADYEPQTTIERLLVERLASLLWRLRRAVAIESGLFQIQGQTTQDRPALEPREIPMDPLSAFRNLLNQNKPRRREREPTESSIEAAANNDQATQTARAPELSRCFLSLAHLDGEILERIERYELSLWRQTAQTMSILNSLQAGLKFYGRTNFRKYPAVWK